MAESRDSGCLESGLRRGVYDVRTGSELAKTKRFLLVSNVDLSHVNFGRSLRHVGLRHEMSETY